MAPTDQTNQVEYILLIIASFPSQQKHVRIGDNKEVPIESFNLDEWFFPIAFELENRARWDTLECVIRSATKKHDVSHIRVDS